MEYQFPPIRFDNRGYIRDSVFSILRNAILDGKLEPGQRLIERSIADQLKISRTPVREAIRQLQYERLVTYIPRKGVVVSGFSKSDIEEIQLIRIALEALSCSIAAGKIKDEELTYLNSIVDQLSAESKKKSSGKLSVLNRKFHECIWKAADSPHLYYFINTLCEYVNKFTHLTYTKPGRIQEVVSEHKAIVSALMRHDSSSSYEAMKKHVEKSGQIFLNMAYPDKRG